jgi:CDP-diacylglycerol---serine O-phosphatidyltransferase
MSKSHKVGMLSFAKDIPNVCSLLGLLSAMFGIYFAIEGNFLASIIGVLWAVLFDWYDGIIARKMKGRTKEQRVFGEQLDSLIDIVSFGILPAVLLLSYGNYSVWFMPGAFIIVSAIAIRLSYFNVYGLIDSKTYMGLSVDNNGLILAFVFLFESFFSHTVFSIILYTLLMVLAALNLASIRIPKLGGKWVYALIAYVLVMTTVFGWILWSRV